MALGMFRAGAVYTLANVLAAGVPFLLLPVLTRALTPAEYGEVVAFFMLVPLCGAVAGLSLHGAVGVRWLAREMGDPASYVASAVNIVCLSTIGTAVACSVLAPMFGINLSPTVCALAAVTSGAMTLQSIRFVIWQSMELPVPAAALQVSASVLNISMSLIGVFVLQQGSMGRIGGAAFGIAMIAVFCVLSLRAFGLSGRGTLSDAKALLRFGVPLIPHVAAGVLLSSVDRFAVAATFGTEALGVYGVAAQLGLVMNVLADAATKAYTPALYRLLGSHSLRARLRMVAITYLSIPVWVLVAIFLWALLAFSGDWLLGERYQGALDIAIWFLLGGAAFGVYLNIAALFFFTGKTEWVSVSTLAAALAALLLAPLAVARYGLTGAAVSYLAAQMIVLLLAWALSTKVYPMPWGCVTLSLRTLRFRRLVVRLQQRSTA